MIRVLFICHGNICRSPMAEYMFKDMLEKLGREYEFEVASAATSTEEIWNGIGNPVYPPAQEELRRHGIGKTEYTDFRKKRARQLTKADYEYYDYLLCADLSNIRDAKRIVGEDKQGKLRLLMDYCGCSERSIADPWYTGNFKDTYKDLEESLQGFMDSFT